MPVKPNKFNASARDKDMSCLLKAVVLATNRLAVSERAGISNGAQLGGVRCGPRLESRRGPSATRAGRTAPRPGTVRGAHCTLTVYDANGGGGAG